MVGTPAPSDKYHRYALCQCSDIFRSVSRMPGARAGRPTTECERHLPKVSPSFMPNVLHSHAISIICVRYFVLSILPVRYVVFLILQLLTFYFFNILPLDILLFDALLFDITSNKRRGRRTATPKRCKIYERT